MRIFFTINVVMLIALNFVTTTATAITGSSATLNGADMIFIPGDATVTTAASTAITLYAATSGGNVIADGGSPVTARGVCWGTAPNPVVSGNHTTNGSGTGIFTSFLFGLTPNTTYHTRAYAVNSTGTFYGNDISFTTLCGFFSLPFNENFSTTSQPACWSQVDHQGNSQFWTFGVMTGQTPLPALTGNYAMLNSNAYGAGNSQNTDLISPAIDLNYYLTVNLQFSHYFKAYTGSTAAVSFSLDNGVTWTQIQQFTATSPTNPVTFSQAVIGAAGHPQVKFKWNYSGNFGDFWAIDNIHITGSTNNPTLSISPISQNVTIAAGSTSFTISSNSLWTASSNQTWCTVTPSGNGNGILVANYGQNATTSSRTASITVSVTGLTPLSVTVIQSGEALSLAVTPPNQQVGEIAGTTSFSVTTNANTSWTATSDQTWCTVTAGGTGNGTISASYTQNPGLSSRVANISVTTPSLAPVVVMVLQAGAAPLLSVMPPNQTVLSPAGSTSFTVSSNTQWSSSSDQTWCAVTESGNGNGTILASYTENPSVLTRVANITVMVTGLPPVAVMVTQMGAAPTLSVNPSNQDVTAPAGSTGFNLETNSSWVALSDQAWCSVPLAGSGNGILTATYQENFSIVPRLATITIQVPGVNDAIVTVTQEGATPTLLVTPANRDVGVLAGTTSFDVSSNSSWTAVSGAAWCSVTLSGNGNDTIEAVYQENTGLNPRVALITVTVDGIGPVDVTVSQEGLVGLSEELRKSIMLSPNPCSGRFTIRSTDQRIFSMEMEILDVKGHQAGFYECRESNTYGFDLTGLSKGSYLLRIRTIDGTIVKKLIID